MKKLLLLMLSVAMFTAFASSGVNAQTPDVGQIEGGDIYRLRNVTKSGTFVNNANADVCDTVQFKVRIHNPGPNPLQNVNVKASLSQGTSTSQSSTVTLTASNNYKNEVITATAGVTINQPTTISYISGSTELLDSSGGRMQTLGDGIMNGGVNIGTVGVSLNQIRYVQFQAKVNCPEPPKPVYITVCQLDNKQIVTINEADFNSSKYSKNLVDCAPTPPQPGYITVCNLTNKTVVTIKESDFNSQTYTKDLSKCSVTPVAPVTPSTPSALPNTGAGAVMGIATAISALGAVGHRFWTLRRLQ